MNPKRRKLNRWRSKLHKEAKAPHIKEAEEWGREAERRFFLAWQEDPDNYPEWLASVTKSTNQEDKAGTDFWFNDIKGGRTAVQTKGSWKGVRHHVDKHPEFDGIIVIVNRNDDYESIRENTMLLMRLKRLLAWLYQKT